MNREICKGRLSLNCELPLNMPEMMRALEDTCIRMALDVSEGNLTRAAKLIGLRRTTLIEKLRRHPVRVETVESQKS